MFEIFLLAIVGLVIWAIVKLIKASGNAKVTVDDNRFKQADVEVEFQSGKIRIKNHEYKVDQVTGIKSEPYTTNRNGDAMAWKAIIEVDDFKKPRHEMVFITKKKASEFTQRLCVALRKAGGPSFS